MNHMILGRSLTFVCHQRTCTEPAQRSDLSIWQAFRRGQLDRGQLDRAPFADWLDRFRRISRAGCGLDCSGHARCAVHFARRCSPAPTLDDSKLRPYRCRHHSADVPASYIPPSRGSAGFPTCSRSSCTCASRQRLRTFLCQPNWPRVALN